jgi:hypothetical protein
LTCGPDRLARLLDQLALAHDVRAATVHLIQDLLDTLQPTVDFSRLVDQVGHL